VMGAHGCGGCEGGCIDDAVLLHLEICSPLLNPEMGLIK